jgi:hypothetical protein
MLDKEAWYALAAKADWEGGWPEYILGYGGVTSTPSIQRDQQFLDAIAAVEKAWAQLEILIDQHIDEYGEYE